MLKGCFPYRLASGVRNIKEGAQLQQVELVLSVVNHAPYAPTRPRAQPFLRAQRDAPNHFYAPNVTRPTFFTRPTWRAQPFLRAQRDAPNYFYAPKFYAPKFYAPKFHAPKFCAPKFYAPNFTRPNFARPNSSLYQIFAIYLLQTIRLISLSTLCTFSPKSTLLLNFDTRVNILAKITYFFPFPLSEIPLYLPCFFEGKNGQM